MYLCLTLLLEITVDRIPLGPLESPRDEKYYYNIRMYRNGVGIDDELYPNALNFAY